MSSSRLLTAFASLGLTALLTVPPAWAGSNDEVRLGFAQELYAKNASLVHHHHPQPLLRAVVVIRIHASDNGWVTDVLRDNNAEPGLTQVALDSVQRCDPKALSPDLIGVAKQEGFVETWLFDSDGTFQVRTLAQAQASE